MKKLFFLALASVAFTQLASADTSYLLVQGPFGINSSLMTFQWQVNYAPGTLTTGLSLMDAVFGVPVDTHTTYQGHEVYTATNTINNQTVSVSYIDFVGDGSFLFTHSFTLGGTTVVEDFSSDPGWVYYVAGGSGTFNGGPYDSNGAWLSANDGLQSRAVSNGSFDGWAFGENGFGPEFTDVTITGFSPTTADFAGATVVNVGAIPEPGSLALLSAGGLLFFRRRR